LGGVGGREHALPETAPVMRFRNIEHILFNDLYIFTNAATYNRKINNYIVTLL
jgi:hypothetical protein